MRRDIVLFFCYTLVMAPLLSFTAWSQSILAPILFNPTAGGGGPVFAIVNTFKAQQTSSVTTLTTGTASTTTGNMLVAILRNNAAVTGCKNALGVTMTQAGTTASQSNVRNAIYYLPNIVGNASEAITCTATSGVMQILGVEVSGAAILTPLDSGSLIGGGFASTSPLVSGTFSTANANEIVIYGVSTSAQINYTAGLIAGQTGTLICVAATCSTANDFLVLEYGIFTSTFSTQTASISPSTSGLYSYNVAAFHN